MADECCQNTTECRVLCLRVSDVHGSLELYTDRKVVATMTPTPARITCMPGALVERHQLRDLAAPVDEHMRRDFDSFEIREADVLRNVEFATKQPLRCPGSEFAFRQRHTVHYDQFDLTPGRALIEMRTGTPTGFIKFSIWCDLEVIHLGFLCLALTTIVPSL